MDEINIKFQNDENNEENEKEEEEEKEKEEEQQSEKNNENILLNTFLINKKKHRVLLHCDRIIWEEENSTKEKTTIPIIDVISIKSSTLLNCKTSFRNDLNQQHQSIINEEENENENENEIEEEEEEHQQQYQQQQQQQQQCFPSTSSIIPIITTPTTQAQKPRTNNNNKQKKQFLLINYCKRIENSQNDYNRWCNFSIKLINSNIIIIKKWTKQLLIMLNELKRPKNLLLFINPFGGKKDSLKIYEKYAKPLFQLADIEVNCIITQRSNQIRDILLNHSIKNYDGICCVGGDGTFNELFNGLIYREINELKLNILKPEYIPKPKLPIGIIPGGSTDTIAYCLHGTIDIKTAVLHIIMGQKNGLDISSVCNYNGLIRFYASIMSYGYLGDVALDSEKFRWMGPKRYDYSGFKKILANRPYEGEIIFLNNDNENDNNKNYLNNFNKSDKSDKNDNKNHKCYMNCLICKKSIKKFNNLINNNKIDYYLFTPTYQLLNNNNNNNKIDLKKWKCIKGKFFMISGANISCACSRSPSGFAPFCHLGDGFINIIVIHHTTILNNIRLLLSLIKHDNKIDKLPFVEIYRTRKFYFRTTTPTTTNTPIASANISNSCNDDDDDDDDDDDEDEADEDEAKPPSERQIEDGLRECFNDNSFSLNGSCQPINETDEIEKKFSQWNCDGDVIHDTDVLVSSHCQLIDVFMRGPYPETDLDFPSTCGFCNT